MLLLRSLYMADPSLAFRNIQQKAFAVSIPSSFQVPRERVFQEIETLFADLTPVFGRVQTFPKLG